MNLSTRSVAPLPRLGLAGRWCTRPGRCPVGGGWRRRPATARSACRATDAPCRSRLTEPLVLTTTAEIGPSRRCASGVAIAAGIAAARRAPASGSPAGSRRPSRRCRWRCRRSASPPVVPDAVGSPVLPGSIGTTPLATPPCAPVLKRTFRVAELIGAVESSRRRSLPPRTSGRRHFAARRARRVGGIAAGVDLVADREPSSSRSTPTRSAGAERHAGVRALLAARRRLPPRRVAPLIGASATRSGC